MKAKVFFLLGLLSLFACRKEFDHTLESQEIPCELCKYASKLEGTYAGIKRYELIPGYHTNPNWETDTFYFNVVQIYLNHGSPVDSTIMYFHVKSKYMSEVTWSNHDTVSIVDSSGCMFNRGCYGHDYWRLFPDYVQEHGDFQINQSSYYNNLHYVGYK